MNLNILAQELISVEEEVNKLFKNIDRDNEEVYKATISSLEHLADRREKLRDQIIDKVKGMQYV